MAACRRRSGRPPSPRGSAAPAPRGRAAPARTVLAAFPTALYLRSSGHADVLPVVTPDGLRLPTALGRRHRLRHGRVGGPARGRRGRRRRRVRLPGRDHPGGAHLAPAPAARCDQRSWSPPRAALAAAVPCRAGATCRRPHRGAAARRAGRAPRWPRSWGRGRASPRAATTCSAACCWACALAGTARRGAASGGRWRRGSPPRRACRPPCCVRPPRGMPCRRGRRLVDRRSWPVRRGSEAAALDEVLAIGHTSGADLLAGCRRAPSMRWPLPDDRCRSPTPATPTGACRDRPRRGAQRRLLRLGEPHAGLPPGRRRAPGVEAAQVAMATELNLDVIARHGLRDAGGRRAQRPPRRDPRRRRRRRSPPGWRPSTAPWPRSRPAGSQAGGFGEAPAPRTLGGAVARRRRQPGAGVRARAARHHRGLDAIDRASR